MNWDRKIAPTWILLFMFAAMPTLIISSCVGYSAFRARRPKDMPNAIWIKAPAAPLGFYRGWWEACWVESDQQTNHCRLYGPGPSVVYEGRFMPCGAAQPVPTRQLTLQAPPDVSEMWDFPGFVAFLENGKILVPIEKLGDCSKIRQKLEQKKTAQLERND